MIGAFYIAEQYLQRVAGFSALGASGALILVALLVGVAAPIAGKLVDRYGETAAGGGRLRGRRHRPGAAGHPRLHPGRPRHHPPADPRGAGAGDAVRPHQPRRAERQPATRRTAAPRRCCRSAVCLARRSGRRARRGRPGPGPLTASTVHRRCCWVRSSASSSGSRCPRLRRTALAARLRAGCRSSGCARTGRSAPCSRLPHTAMSHQRPERLRLGHRTPTGSRRRRTPSRAPRCRPWQAWVTGTSSRASSPGIAVGPRGDLDGAAGAEAHGQLPALGHVLQVPRGAAQSPAHRGYDRRAPAQRFAQLDRLLQLRLAEAAPPVDRPQPLFGQPLRQMRPGCPPGPRPPRRQGC